MENKFEKIGEVEYPDGEGQHAMAVLNDWLLVMDGKNIYRLHIPPKTIWQKIKDLF